MNELLLFVEVIIIFSLLLLMKKFFGKNGVITWVALASVLANIQVAKSVDVFGLSATLGNVLFASTFLATDILSECYGEKYSKKAVFIGLFSIIIYIISTQIALLYIPNSIDIVNEPMKQLFSLAPRICISSVVMYFIANFLDVVLFEKLKKIFNGKKLWLRNNVSTILCNCLENFGFVFLSFIGVYPIQEILTIALTTCVIEIIIALCDTPFLYIAKKIKDKQWN